MPSKKTSPNSNDKNFKKQKNAPIIRWWTVKYWIAVQDGQDPHYFINALLVNMVVGPVLKQHLDCIPLYRFHCVYHPEKKKGHEWTVWFYCDKNTASAMYKSLKADTLVAQLKNNNLLVDIEYEDLRKKEKVEIKDGSDTSKQSGWHPFIQETWPYYAKGVSECWWQLVNVFAEALEKELVGRVAVDDPNYLFTLYQAVEENIKNQWQANGQHVFMHHLHAIISWEPISYRPRMKIELVRM